MEKIGQPIRLGMWTVKHDKIQEFIKAWQSSADWIAHNLPDDGEGVLVQDAENPNKFISFAFSANPDQAQEVISRSEYQELFSTVRTLCDSIQPQKMQVVGYTSSSKDE